MSIGGAIIKRPIVVITLGAIYGIICGSTWGTLILLYASLLVIVLQKYSKSFIKNDYIKKKYNYIDKYFSKENQRKLRICCKYIKTIFSKKLIMTFIISSIVFNMYTMFLNKKYENFYRDVTENVELEATVISDEKENEYYSSYKVKGKTGIFNNKKFILYVKKGTLLEYGDRVKIEGVFYEPTDSRNYKGFDYKKYLQTEKVFGTIKADDIEIQSKNNNFFIFKLSNSIRNKIIKQVRILLPEETSGLLIGIMLGDKDYILDDLKLNFQKSGLAHILAVSGAHVSYIILGLTYLLSINKVSKKRGYIFIIFTLIAFIFLTDFSVSVIRACIMVIILIISKLFYKKADIMNTIAVSALIILIFNPYSLNSASMQLSYLGTIGVIFVTPVVENFLKNIYKSICNVYTRSEKSNESITFFLKPDKIIKAISVPIAAQIAILPIIITNFNTVSFIFLVSNVLVMPILGACIISGYIFTLSSFIWFWGIIKITSILNLLLRIMILIVNFFGRLEISYIYVTVPTKVTIILYYSLIYIVVYLQYVSKDIKTVKRIGKLSGKVFKDKGKSKTKINRVNKKNMYNYFNYGCSNRNTI